MTLEFLRQYFMLTKLMPKTCVFYNRRFAIEKDQSSMYNGKFRHVSHRHNSVKHLLSNENFHKLYKIK